MTPEQITTLSTALLSTQDAELQAAVVARNDSEVARLLNLPAVPAFTVYKSALSRHDILTGTSSTGTTFSWTAGAYITRSQGERDAFREIFNSTGTVNPALPSIRAAFADIFSGAGGVGNRAHITAMSKRTVTACERVFATGAGSDADPGLLGFEGSVSVSDVSAALNG